MDAQLTSALHRPAVHDPKWFVLVVCFTMTLVVSAATYLVADPTRVSRVSTVIDGLASGLLVAVLVGFRRRLGPSFYQALVAIGTGLISATIALNSLPLGTEVYYVLAVLYAGYFFTPRQVAVQVGLILAAYGAALLVGTDDGGISSRWLNLSGVVVVLGAVVVILRRRIEQLISSLDHASQTDSLTELLNRRAFETKLREAATHSAQHGSTLSLLAIDIDHFKSVNDRFGHPAGDAALIHVAAILRRGCRPSDVLARVGGEEFAVLLPETNGHAAVGIAERLRADIESNPAPGIPPLTVSLGVATIIGAGRDELFSLQRDADRALYLAKEQGRNRVATSAPTDVSSLSSA